MVLYTLLQLPSYTGTPASVPPYLVTTRKLFNMLAPRVLNTTRLGKPAIEVLRMAATAAFATDVHVECRGRESDLTAAECVHIIRDVRNLRAVTVFNCSELRDRDLVPFLLNKCDTLESFRFANCPSMTPKAHVDLLSHKNRGTVVACAAHTIWAHMSGAWYWSVVSEKHPVVTAVDGSAPTFPGMTAAQYASAAISVGALNALVHICSSSNSNNGNTATTLTEYWAGSAIAQLVHHDASITAEKLLSSGVIQLIRDNLKKKTDDDFHFVPACEMLSCQKGRREIAQALFKDAAIVDALFAALDPAVSKRGLRYALGALSEFCNSGFQEEILKRGFLRKLRFCNQLKDVSDTDPDAVAAKHIICNIVSDMLHGHDDVPKRKAPQLDLVAFKRVYDDFPGVLAVYASQKFFAPLLHVCLCFGSASAAAVHDARWKLECIQKFADVGGVEVVIAGATRSDVSFAATCYRTTPERGVSKILGAEIAARRELDVSFGVSTLNAIKTKLAIGSHLFDVPLNKIEFNREDHTVEIS